MNAKQRRVMRRAKKKPWRLAGAWVEQHNTRFGAASRIGSPDVEIFEIGGVAFYRNLAGELVELPF